MARGDKKTYNQQQQQSYGQASDVASQASQNQQALLGSAMPGYRAELASPGYTPAEQQAITQATEGSLAGAFGAARSRMADTAARTGNPAGYVAGEEELAREQGQQNAQALGGLEEAFGQARIQGEQNALQGLSGLYGETNPQISSGLGAQSSLVGTQGRVATQPGFWSRVASNWLSPAGIAGARGMPGAGARGGGGK